jgi:hypothetical protein
MIKSRCALLLALAGLVLVVALPAACTPRPADQPDGDATAVSEGAPGAAGEGQPTRAPTLELQPMIASGSAPPPATAVGPTATTLAPAAGIQRAVTMEEAKAGVPFAILEPKALPDETYRDLQYVVTAPSGVDNPELPGVRMIYTVAGRGTLVVFESPATGKPCEGESLDINGHPACFVSGQTGTDLLVWEQDGLRIEFRGRGLDQPTLLAAAQSMAPVP